MNEEIILKLNERRKHFSKCNCGLCEARVDEIKDLIKLLEENEVVADGKE